MSTDKCVFLMKRLGWAGLFLPEMQDSCGFKAQVGAGNDIELRFCVFLYGCCHKMTFMGVFSAQKCSQT